MVASSLPGIQTWLNWTSTNPPLSSMIFPKKKHFPREFPTFDTRKKGHRVIQVAHGHHREEVATIVIHQQCGQAFNSCGIFALIGNLGENITQEAKSVHQNVRFKQHKG